MCKVTFCLMIFILSYAQGYSQNPIPKEDSLRIESLKKRLPNLKGSAKVDCLNNIGKEYYNLPQTARNHHAAYYYTKQAYSLALKIDYKYGQALSLLEIGNNVSTTTAAEVIIKQAILIGQLLNNNKILGWAYLRLGWWSYYQRAKAVELWKKALYCFEKAGDTEGEAAAAFWLCDEYSSWKGDYEAAFPYCEKALLASKKMGIQNINSRDNFLQKAHMGMSELYMEVGDYKTAMDLLIEGKNYGITKKLGWQLEGYIGRLFDKMGKHDSAYSYLKLLLDSRPDYLWAKVDLGQHYLATKQYDKALKLFIEAESMNWYPVQSASLLLNLANTYEGKGDYTSALPYALKGIRAETAETEMANGFRTLSRIYQKLGKNDSAFFYLQKYVTLKDSITDNQLLWRLNNNLYRYQRAAEDQKKATAIALLKKDILLKEQLIKEQALVKEQKEITIQLLDKDNKLKQQQLKQEINLKEQKEAKIALLDKENQIKLQTLKQQSLVKNFLLAGLLGFLLTGFFIYRNLTLKRKNEKLGRQRIENELKLQQLESDKKHSEMQQQATELEMQALRAQMNPHFIFNCLSSINKYIIKNETEAASDYLTRFSRLIRMVLINSQKSMITLEDELDMLRLYLDMERLRFNNVFDYNITFTNTLEPAAVFIPPLMLQPFCENAIWHGLMHKTGQGKLDIALSIQDDILYCSITDNGVGRLKSAELKSKSAERQKSLGLKITNNRLALLNKRSREDSHYEMNDILDEKGNTGGTQVDIRIHYKDLVGELNS